ncbi:MAG: DUF433 domain-containing protein [Elusimicrobia bacterium]|nr:DUF433 domain-containing protein [Elusimicrobiota bacterium]
MQRTPASTATSTTSLDLALSDEVTRPRDTLGNERAERRLLIGCDQSICSGEPIILGTRISVANIVELHHHLGWGLKNIHEEYPHLNPEQIRGALEYYDENTKQIDSYLQEEREIENE